MWKEATHAIVMPATLDLVFLEIAKISTNAPTLHRVQPTPSAATQWVVSHATVRLASDVKVATVDHQHQNLSSA